MSNTNNNNKGFFSTFKESFVDSYKKGVKKTKYTSGYTQGYAVGRIVARMERKEVNDPEYQGFCAGLSSAEIDSAE